MKLKEQWEEDAIFRFISFLQIKENQSYGITDRNVKVENGQNFDYEITDSNNNKKAVELFRMVESEKGLAQGRAWSNVIEELKKEIGKRKLAGYLVYTPTRFQYKKNELSVFAIKQADVIETAIKENEGQKEFKFQGFEFHKIEDLDHLSFSAHSGVRSIDSSGTALASFNRLLPTKNGQLQTNQHERILLVLNWAWFVAPSDAIKALTKIDLNLLGNIDEIYFEVRENQFERIFDRSVFVAIANKLQVINHDLQGLLNENLNHLLAEKNPDSFGYVKFISDSIGNVDWIFDNQTREQVILFAEAALQEKGDIDNALWALKMFKNDSDPYPDGSNSKKDSKGEYNWHKRVLDGEDVNAITTVRGHLCWLMSSLVVTNKPELYKEIIETIINYSKEDNLYIRMRVAHPLTELVRRRLAVKNQDGSPFDWDDKERLVVRELAFSMLRQNAKHPRVMHALLHVFDFLRDVDEGEAVEIITLFLNTKEEYVLHDLAALVVYYALFRYKDWPKKGNFDSSQLIRILKEQIVNGDDSIKSSIAWHLWKIIKEKYLPYSEVKEYVWLFLSGKYNPQVISMLALTIEELAKTDKTEAIALYKETVNKIADFLRENPGQNHYWLNSTEEVLPLMAPDPSELMDVVRKLMDLWKNGVYVGDPTVIFNLYKLVPTELKDGVKNELMDMYKKMKSINPHVADINWSN